MLNSGWSPTSYKCIARVFGKDNFVCRSVHGTRSALENWGDIQKFGAMAHIRCHEKRQILGFVIVVRLLYSI